MKNIKRTLWVFLAVFMLINTAFVYADEPEAEVETLEGFEFPVGDMYKMESTIDTLPNTFEATVFFPETMSSSERGGVILGNYGGATRCMNFEIHKNGSPRIYMENTKGAVRDYVFDDVNVYTGEWTHVAVVIEDRNIHCYINGELAQTLKCGTMFSEELTEPLVAGGDLRSGNSMRFKGRIKNLALYSDSRTADEIKADSESSEIDTNGLITGFDFTGIDENNLPDSITNLNPDASNLKLITNWLKTIPETKDYAYSMALVGDTQIITQYHPEDLACIYDWIVDNVEEKKIKFVMGLGDITNSNTPAEWEVATENIFKMDGVVPYSLCRGNHDSSLRFTRAFEGTKYVEQLDGIYQDVLENTWQELIIGEMKYLIMTLDIGADDDVLNWASEIIEAHPEHNVIVTTHVYLYRDGTTLDQNDDCPATKYGGKNNGDDIWEKLISQHENITMVISGHDPCDRIIVTQEEGVHGNVVTQMLVDPQGLDAAQGATGLVAMLYFSEDGKDVSVEFYSTVKNQYYMAENQFDMHINSITPPKPEAQAKPAPADKDNSMTIAIIASVAILVIIVAVLYGMNNKKKKN